MSKKDISAKWIYGCYHIETPLGIINIRPNLEDFEGNKIDSIEILPNSMDNVIFPDFEGYKALNVRLKKKINKEV
jgi:hypothetical protein